MPMKICVYAASSDQINPAYIAAAEELGQTLARRGHSLVFGGGAQGLMGAVARGVSAAGGEILGVAPSFFNVDGVLYPHCTEFIYTETMRQRKQIMEDNAEAFIIVPGGIGTFEEFFEILTLKQLCRHDKPIAIYNIKGYYDEMLYMLEKATEKQFIRGGCMDLFRISEYIDELLDYVENPHRKQRAVQDLKDG
jgi:uncharacterized protein (TIGR00730 family)